MTRSIQTTDGVTYGGGSDPNYWMTYSYNLSGALIEQQYPSGRKVKNVLDSDGELAEVKSKKNPSHAYWNFANHFSYNAAGAVTSMQFGTGRWESTTFNNRLQPTQIALGKTQNATDLLKLDYQYGDLNWDGSVIAGTNNGNVAKQTITVAAVGATPGFTAVQNYDYDSLNRIQIASETLTPTTGTPETWVQEFRYDRFGNRTFHEPTTTTLPKNCGTPPNLTVCTADVPVVNPSVSPSNNRLNGYTFDTSGNTTRDAENRKFTYDAENKQVKVESLSPGTQTVTGTIGEYVYDGDGRRVKKRGYTSGVLTEETIFVYDAASKLVAEYSNQVASPQDAKVANLTNDHLGSPRINTDINGNVTARHDYHPFGEEIATSHRTTSLGHADDTVRKRFTGYERDDEIGLDFAQARTYSYSHGRFTSPDPYGGSGIVQIPQSWNRYAYCLNRPYAFTDPSGLIWLTTDDKNYIWVDDKEYKKNAKKYENHKVANEAIIKLNEVTGFGGKYDKLVNKFVSLNANGTISEVPDPTTIVRMDGQEDNMIGVSLGTLTYDPADQNDPLRGPPGGHRRFGTTIRIYNADGKPYVDVDHHTDHGAGTPHIHWWDWDNQAEPRGKAEPLPGWFGEDGIYDDGIPVHSPFARRPFEYPPRLTPVPSGRPLPGGAPQPMPVRPMIPLRPMIPVFP